MAPGERIISCRSHASLTAEEPDGFHTAMTGTSMAAPHVTGAAALLLEVRPDLLCEQVKQILARSTRRDDFAAGAPDGLWGDGKLDIAAAVNVAGQARFPPHTERASHRDGRALADRGADHRSSPFP